MEAGIVADRGWVVLGCAQAQKGTGEWSGVAVEFKRNQNRHVAAACG